ncbi:MAG: hypothetical protein IT449_11750 [Phycisphaerales bacterium]|nr:hypothetical protein [Phycisphaerales bacterium]
MARLPHYLHCPHCEHPTLVPAHSFGDLHRCRQCAGYYRPSQVVPSVATDLASPETRTPAPQRLAPPSRPKKKPRGASVIAALKSLTPSAAKPLDRAS